YGKVCGERDYSEKSGFIKKSKVSDEEGIIRSEVGVDVNGLCGREEKVYMVVGERLVEKSLGGEGYRELRVSGEIG
ncbi:hypothetical protein, partial [Staphylococcus pettenkoferi]|uniref:hypothetical protein n=1 Tax=Staphylococcus pettenkoferi TaxID=170573 RepID=UPI001C92CC58